MDESVEVLMDPSSGPALPASLLIQPVGTETVFAEVLAELLGQDQVSVTGHFFDDLGANSLVMAQFCARVRKRQADLPSVSMKNVYQHPTIRSLATALVGPSAATGAPGAADVDTARVAPSPAASPDRTSIEPSRATTRQYVVCGALQLLIFLGYSYLAGLAAISGYTWISAAPGVAVIYLRSVAFGGAAFIAMCTFPILAKWALIGRWEPSEFPVWSLAYLRFWTVKSLLHANPMILFVGNPLYVLYLRALGARIGRGVTILSPSVPVCTDLLTIGAGSVIRKDASILCYRAHAGRIQTGSVTLGRAVFVGEKTVLDINTSMGDDAQLGHTSALQSGQAVPDGEHWHGSPAQPTELDYVRVAPARCGTLRRAAFAVLALLQVLLVYLPLAVGGLYMLLTRAPSLGARLGTEEVDSRDLYLDAGRVSLVLFVAFLVLGITVMFTVPRLLHLVMEPDRVYPLYGVHYSTHRAIARLTNVKFFTWLFGDSSYIVHYLRSLGYDLNRVEQTGSNFGTEVQHETPFLTSVGSGTMVADGLSVVNADFSSTSFRVSRASIGARNFLGNNIAYPSGGRTGENCLLATKVMVPLDGEVREGVGLLGSPCFEIPRSVERDSRFDHLRTGDELRRRLAAKNRYNLRSMALFLVIRWVHVFVLTTIALAAVDSDGALGQLLVAASLALGLAFTAGYFVLVERTIARFRGLRPQLCSIYEPYFWWHERLWKVPDTYLDAFNGTPFKNVVWRLLGVRLGSRVFDDGCYLTERTLTSIGDDSTLNVGSKLQCHSQEDGTFKSERITIGDGCTLGIGAFVHYGVVLGERSVLAADSFLMKGQEIPPDARWAGNPASEVRAGELNDELGGRSPAQIGGE